MSCEGLLPQRWLLIGNGRRDVTHEDFRKHVHDVLTEFGPKPEQPAWDAFAKRVLFAGGGFTTESPGSLLDVISIWDGVFCVRYGVGRLAHLGS